MSEEVKVYIECYGGLWEVFDPQFLTDGAVESTKYRLVTDEDYTERLGTFTAPVVYEDLNGLLQRFGAEADPEPENATDDELVPVDVVSVEMGGALGQAVEALLTLAEDEGADDEVRLHAAEVVITTFLLAAPK